MKKLFLVLCLLIALVSAENATFLLERAEVTISDVKPDGSARVHESVKFIMFGEYAQSLYDSGISNNDLSFWSTSTNLKDVRFHVNPSRVDIREFRLRPQPRTKCNPIQLTCHGELILDYLAYPARNSTNQKFSIPGTGLFTVSQYKPRTRLYSINPSALSFTTTTEGNFILENNVFLTVKMPPDSRLIDVNPQPTGKSLDLPSHIDSLSWTDIVLVKFSLLFDFEDPIEKEVTDFFMGAYDSIYEVFSGPHGVSILILIAILIGSHAYIILSKRKIEE